MFIIIQVLFGTESLGIESELNAASTSTQVQGRKRKREGNKNIEGIRYSHKAPNGIS